MDLDKIENHSSLSFEEIMEILEEEMYQDRPQDNPYKPLDFNDED